MQDQVKQLSSKIHKQIDNEQMRILDEEAQAVKEAKNVRFPNLNNIGLEAKGPPVKNDQTFYRQYEQD